MAGIRELAVQFRDALVSSDPGVSTGEVCAEIAEELARTEKACAAARVRYAARASECGEHRKRGFADASDWMARSAGSTAGAARAALGTVKAVDACPATKDALAAGEVSLEQAREIASVPEHEAELLELARTSGSRAVKDAARKLRLEAIDPEELSAKQHAAREFVHWKDDLGMIRFRGALPPSVGVSFVNRLDAETDREWRAAKRGPPRVTRRARRRRVRAHARRCRHRQSPLGGSGDRPGPAPIGAGTRTRASSATSSAVGRSRFASPASSPRTRS